MPGLRAFTWGVRRLHDARCSACHRERNNRPRRVDRLRRDECLGDRFDESGGFAYAEVGGAHGVARFEFRTGAGKCDASAVQQITPVG